MVLGIDISIGKGLVSLHAGNGNLISNKAADHRIQIVVQGLDILTVDAGVLAGTLACRCGDVGIDVCLGPAVLDGNNLRHTTSLRVEDTDIHYRTSSAIGESRREALAALYLLLIDTRSLGGADGIFQIEAHIIGHAIVQIDAHFGHCRTQRCPRLEGVYILYGERSLQQVVVTSLVKNGILLTGRYHHRQCGNCHEYLTFRQFHCNVFICYNIDIWGQRYEIFPKVVSYFNKNLVFSQILRNFAADFRKNERKKRQ